MKAIIYVHGKGGSHLEANDYKKNCEGFDIIGIDYDEYLPWIVKPKIQLEFDKAIKIYDEVYLIANSIGAYFSMLALQNTNIKKALFISPILDMEELILNMLSWANSNEEDLKEKEEIKTDFGETLSWEYLKFVREHPIDWNVFTEIIYGENDNLTSYKTVSDFVQKHNANLTVMTSGEHWFHTKDQIEFLNEQMKMFFTQDI